MLKVNALSQKGIADFLGDGPKNIGQAGCLLTCITMAANAYTPDKRAWTPQSLNNYLRTIHLFVGSKLLVELSLRRVNLQMVNRGPIFPTDVQSALLSGELVIVGVDYKPGASSAIGKADHFVLFMEYDREDKQYVAIDPASGRTIRFDENAVCKLSPSVTYRAVEQILLRKRST